MAKPRTLLLVRHAKSSWAHTGQTDFERPLNPRGQRDSVRMRDWLQQRLQSEAIALDWIWSSTAMRAAATTEYIRQAANLTPHRVGWQDTLYHAMPETIVAQAAETPPDAQAAALVAHNPGLTQCVNLLAGEYVLDNLPTLGIAAFAVNGDWVQLRPGVCELLWVVSPKTLEH